MLQRGIQCRVNLEPFLVEGGFAIGTIQVTPHFLHEIGGQIAFFAGLDTVKDLRFGSARLVGADVPFLDHAGQHMVSAARGQFGIAERRIGLGALHQTRQHRRLRQGHFPGGLPEKES